VTAAAVILPARKDLLRRLAGVNDSKKLTAETRLHLRERIQAEALAHAVGMASSAEIDTLGIVPATRLAMMRAICALLVPPDALLIDAVRLHDLALHQRIFNFADSISLSVAAASILAKTARDEIMQTLDKELPAFRFALHKGYGTAAHRAALQHSGVSMHHRVSYKPIRALLLP
jgi:ribonuclease HII